VRTLVVSDLHLGSRSEADVLRDPTARDALVTALDGVDRLVLLGDVLELREGPVADAVDAARPVLAAIGAALGPDSDVIVLAGNHDHALVSPWLEGRAVARPLPLRAEERLGPQASPLAGAVAEALSPARVDVAYPGVWLRDDVYATHGHYLDVHVTVPSFERLAIGAVRRLMGVTRPPAGVDDYERILAPVYGWQHAVARNTPFGSGLERRLGSQHAWRLLAADGGGWFHTRALRLGFRGAVAASNRLGLGPVSTDVSSAALRRAGLHAMRQSADALSIDARWVVFGHTHRAGPRDRDDPVEWEGLVNTGSWVHEKVFLGADPARSSYWPGGAVEIDAETGRAPRPVNLLRSYWTADPDRTTPGAH
jgi:predicted phosphodiesterase